MVFMAKELRSEFQGYGQRDGGSRQPWCGVGNVQGVKVLQNVVFGTKECSRRDTKQSPLQKLLHSNSYILEECCRRMQEPGYLGVRNIPRRGSVQHIS